MFYTKKNHKHCAELEDDQMNTFVLLKIAEVVGKMFAHICTAT